MPLSVSRRRTTVLAGRMAVTAVMSLSLVIFLDVESLFRSDTCYRTGRGFIPALSRLRFNRCKGGTFFLGHWLPRVLICEHVQKFATCPRLKVANSKCEMLSALSLLRGLAPNNNVGGGAVTRDSLARKSPRW